MRRLLGTLGFVAGALALSGCWAVPGGDGDRSSNNPWEDELTAETVDGLTEQWRWTAPAGELTDPVLSNSGVHVGSGCGLATLRPSTGELLWGNATGSEAMCTSGFYVGAGEPYVFDGPSGQRVQGSSGLTVPRAPANFIAEFSSRDFDAVTGEPSTEPAGGAFLVARRGNRQVHSTVGPTGPLTATNTVKLGDRFFTQHVFNWGTTPPWPPTAFTLGADKLFHAGGGVLASEPGPATFGNGIRGYSITEARPGCGPAMAGFPTPSPHPVECPVWATPTDGIPTIPVLSPNGDTVYTRTSAGTLYAIDTANGAVRWTATGLGAAGKPALAHGMLFVPTDTGRVLLFNATGCGAAVCPPDSPNGFDTGTGAAVTAVSVAGNVIYATSAGNVHASGECWSGEGCLLAWSGPGTGSPVISGGRLYIRDAGDLVAYGLDG